MSELENDLVAIGQLIEPPPFAFDARALRAPEPRRGRRWPVVLAGVLSVLGIASLNTPVVADWLRAGGVEIRRESAPGAAQPLSLGRQIVLDHNFSLPAELGEPDEYWRDDNNLLWFAYRARPSLPALAGSGYGALLGVSRASLADDVLAVKFVGPTTRVQPVSLGTGRAFWIEGAHHFALASPRGDVLVDRVRLAENVLLWELDGNVWRFESSLGRDASLRIARGIR